MISFYIFRPSPGEIRQIYIEKSSEQLGITIDEGSAGTSKKGVFVSSVSEHSLAFQVGLQVNNEIAVNVSTARFKSEPPKYSNSLELSY